VEPNDTVLNSIKKAQGPHRERVMELLGRADVPFPFDEEACNHLYLFSGDSIPLHRAPWPSHGAKMAGRALPSATRKVPRQDTLPS
jgi:hypothetical protein